MSIFHLNYSSPVDSGRKTDLGSIPSLESTLMSFKNLASLFLKNFFFYLEFFFSLFLNILNFSKITSLLKNGFED